MAQKLNKSNHFGRLVEFTIQKENHDGIKKIVDSKQCERIAHSNQATQATQAIA